MDPNHLAHRVAALAAADPDLPCLFDGTVVLSRAEVHARADALARAFRAEGLAVGDRIAVDLPNGAAWIVTLLAAARAGLTIVPVDPGLGWHALLYQLRHADVAAAVIPEVGGAFDYLELFDELLPELPGLQLIAYAGPGTAWFDDRAVPFEELIARGRRQPPVDPPHLAVPPLALVYTSGTMGKPKGVLQGHDALVECALVAMRTLQIAPESRLLAVVPFCHGYGLSLAIGALAHGAALVLLPRFEPALALEAIAAHRVTHLPGTPTIFELLMRDPAFAGADLSSLRGGMVAGGAVTPALADRIRAWCNVELVYGLTEGGPAVAMTSPDDPPAKRRTTVGRPLPGVEVRVVDVRSGELHVHEAVGELAVRSPYLMLGYHRMPVETARVMTGAGYLLTGDLVLLDEDGYLTVVARRKEVIVRAGQSVTPREVEDVLRTHPGVDDACVVGIPHEVLGELICACVVLVEGAVVTGQELLRYAHDHLAATKVPDQVRFFDGFPRTGAGMVKRQELARVVGMGG